MRAARCPEEIRHDVRASFTAAAAFAIASACLSLPAPAFAQAMPTGEPTPPPKHQCATARSKWERTQCQNYNNGAPADEYFGRQKISVIGIQNNFHDLNIESGDNTTSPSIINKLNFVTEAMAKWAAKYPNDPDLAHTYYLGVLALQKVYVQNEQELAWQYAQIITRRYPKTYFGKKIAEMSKDGFVEHWYADAQPCDAANADPSPSPSPNPGKPVIAILRPPCTGSPAANTQMAAPSPTPAPHGKNAPAAAATNPPQTPAPASLPSPSTPPAKASPNASKATPSPKPSGTPVPGPNPPPPAV